MPDAIIVGMAFDKQPSGDLPASPKFLAARGALPEHLQPIYDQLVLDYSWLTTKRYGRGYVAYDVLADLVRSGWRPTSQQL